MEDQDQVVNQDVVPTDNVTESTPVEPTVDSSPQDVEPTVDTPEVAPEVPEEKPTKRDAQGRIQQLVAEKKQAQQERDYYARLAQEQANQPLPEEVDPNEYRALQYNNNIVAQELHGLKMERLAEKLESAAERTYQEFPELKENPQLDEKLTSMWEEAYAQKNQAGEIVGYTKSPLDFAKEQMEIIRSAQANATAQTAQALERQASDSAVTPQTNQSTAPKEFKDLSISEMEAQLGVVRN